MPAQLGAVGSSTVFWWLLLFHLFFFFARSFSFDLMGQQGTEIENTCCLIRSFLRRIFTCYFYIIKSFLQHLGNTILHFHLCWNALSLSWFTLPALRSLWGPAALPGPESFVLVGGLALALLQDMSLSPRGVQPWLVACCQPWRKIPFPFFYSAVAVSFL